MWQVLFTEKSEQEIKSSIKKGDISEDDMRVISIWIKQVKKHGPESLGQNSNWNDHALDRQWSGHRASNYSFNGRIIYRVDGKKIIVKVVRITPDHDYS
ncbi:MAG: hypothetical protein DRQ89_11965 [Epsilonproteobacteria bacterium]|nr:MAG: hypothetical protein DRQ89_11965 [Campylobacterota bacterium]